MHLQPWIWEVPHRITLPLLTVLPHFASPHMHKPKHKQQVCLEMPAEPLCPSLFFFTLGCFCSFGLYVSWIQTWTWLIQTFSRSAPLVSKFRFADVHVWKGAWNRAFSGRAKCSSQMTCHLQWNIRLRRPRMSPADSHVLSRPLSLCSLAATSFLSHMPVSLQFLSSELRSPAGMIRPRLENATLLYSNKHTGNFCRDSELRQTSEPFRLIDCPALPSVVFVQIRDFGIGKLLLWFGTV